MHVQLASVGDDVSFHEIAMFSICLQPQYRCKGRAGYTGATCLREVPFDRFCQVPVIGSAYRHIAHVPYAMDECLNIKSK